MIGADQANGKLDKYGEEALVWLRTEHQPVNQRVTDSIPSQGPCLGYKPGPQDGA